jgi:hypothetical protein
MSVSRNRYESHALGPLSSMSHSKCTIESNQAARQKITERDFYRQQIKAPCAELRYSRVETENLQISLKSHSLGALDFHLIATGVAQNLILILPPFSLSVIPIKLGYFLILLSNCSQRWRASLIARHLILH